MAGNTGLIFFNTYHFTHTYAYVHATLLTMEVLSGGALGEISRHEMEEPTVRAEMSLWHVQWRRDGGGMDGKGTVLSLRRGRTSAKVRPQALSWKKQVSLTGGLYPQLWDQNPVHWASLYPRHIHGPMVPTYLTQPLLSGR